MAEDKKMLKCKQDLADRLSLRNITMIYANNDCPIVFIMTKEMSAKDVTVMLAEEGYELDKSPQDGIYATTFLKKEGYWCELKQRAAEKTGGWV